jgi:hypothetical protein
MVTDCMGLKLDFYADEMLRKLCETGLDDMVTPEDLAEMEAIVKGPYARNHARIAVTKTVKTAPKGAPAFVKRRAMTRDEAVEFQRRL